MKHYEIEGISDFYTFDFEESAKEFSNSNTEYNNVYYSYSWGKWIASKNCK